MEFETNENYIIFLKVEKVDVFSRKPGDDRSETDGNNGAIRTMSATNIRFVFPFVFDGLLHGLSAVAWNAVVSPTIIVMSQNLVRDFPFQTSTAAAARGRINGPITRQSSCDRNDFAFSPGKQVVENVRGRGRFDIGKPIDE